jgi:hypothetical protein
VRYVVTLTIENRAVRIPLRFHNAWLALFDPREEQHYPLDGEEQRAYEEDTGRRHSDPLVLEAGESTTKDYVFVVPSGAAAPRLRIAPGGWLSLIIHRLLLGAREFQLP